MSNVLFKVTGKPMGQVIADWKEYTARVANKVLGRSGQFWARDYWAPLLLDLKSYGIVHLALEFLGVAKAHARLENGFLLRVGKAPFGQSAMKAIPGERVASGKYQTAA
jgi:hypothetical protein